MLNQQRPVTKGWTSAGPGKHQPDSLDLVASAYIAPLLYVGVAPATIDPWIRGTVHVQTPHEAARWMANGYLVVVPSSEIARQAMLMSGSGYKATMYATGGYAHRYDEGLGSQ